MEPPGKHEALTKSVEKTVTGLQQNVEAAGAYALFLISGILLLLIEKKNPFVRFHAMQSTVTFGGLFVAYQVFGLVPLLGGLLKFATAVAWIGLWIHLAMRAFRGERYKLPVVGDLCESLLERIQIPD